MWIVRVALDRPYTFIVLALLILLASPVLILRTPTDIFPNIDIPVIAVAWQFTGLNPEEMEGRITTQFERVLTTTVDNIEHLESTTVNGQAMIKIFLQPNARLDTANAQVTAVSQTILRQLPAGTQPPLIINYSASTVPILQLALSGLSESELNDAGQNFLRTQLVTVPGVSIPYPFGGKQRQVMVDLDTRLLQAKGLSPADVVTALGQQNIVLPSGTAKIGQFEYDVAMNASPRTVAELNDLPIKVVNNSPIYIGDVAHVRDGFAPQTNVVRRDGNRGTLVTILKAGTASTLDVVAGIRALLPRVIPTLPPQLKIAPLADQSIFVRAAVNGVIREAVIAACLTAVMILLFLGSWRSTLIIAISIPLSILTSVSVLSLLGETINIMTLGGLALAVGILVDDATVTIENIERYLEEGRDGHEAILQGAAQIAVPALVSTLCICIVFLPMFFLGGVPRYLFVPLAEAVVFAMLASYILSRTLVPTLAMYLLRRTTADSAPTRNPLARFQAAFNGTFERARLAYRGLLTRLVGRRLVFIPVFLVICACAFLLAPRLGTNFFPDTDSGQFMLHLRAQTGTRIEETARLTDVVEDAIRREIPADEMDVILDNIGLPYSSINWMHSASGVIGAGDADILVSLKPEHRPTQDYVRALRQKLPEQFPGVTFYFLPADIVTQIINFGLPAPIDIQIEGADVQGNRQVANAMLDELRRVPGLVDLRVHQRFDYPKFDVALDRTRAGQAGFTTRDVAGSLLVSLSGSFQTTPTFFLKAERGQLQPGHPDSAISGPVPARHREHPAHVPRRRRARGHPGQRRVDLARQRDGRGVALQHPARRGHLRRRAGPRPRRGRPRHHQDRRRPPLELAEGQLPHGPGPAPDHADVVLRALCRARLLDRPRLPADRRELPVVARSLHHHHGAAGRSGRDRGLSVPDWNDLERPRPDGSHHEHRRCDSQQHPGGSLRPGAARRARRRHSRGHRGRLHTVPSRADDSTRHDHRYGPDGAGLR